MFDIALYSCLIESIFTSMISNVLQRKDHTLNDADLVHQFVNYKFHEIYIGKIGKMGKTYCILKFLEHPSSKQVRHLESPVSVQSRAQLRNRYL